MKMKPFFSKRKRALYAFLSLVGLAVLITAAVFGGDKYRQYRAFKTAELAMQHGFPAVAVDAIEPVRHLLVDRADRCRLTFTAYAQTRNPARLDWAAQACIYNGIEIPEDYIALSLAHEMSGHADEALQILTQATPKFAKLPDILYSKAQLLRRMKKDADAVTYWKAALERAPKNNQMAIELLEYLGQLKDWKNAKPIAEKLKSVKTDNPEVKYFLARILLKAGDHEAARSLSSEAGALVKPEMKDLFKKAYSDVYDLK